MNITPIQTALVETGFVKNFKPFAGTATEFDMVTLRLKLQLRIVNDYEVAEVLDLNVKAFTARKQRNSFPTKNLLALAVTRPDLKIDFNYVLTGEI